MKKRWLCDDQAASQLPGKEVDGLIGVTNTVDRYQSHRIIKKRQGVAPQSTSFMPFVPLATIQSVRHPSRTTPCNRAFLQGSRSTERHGIDD